MSAETKKTEQEKVEERREEVLAKGRKFKYPLQYAKHKLVFTTIIIAVFALVLSGVLGWAMLYKWQYTSDVVYRLTQVLPVPVASVQGEGVRYSDYLMIYRSSLTPVEQQQGKLGNDEDAEAMRTHYKRAALTEAENYAYAVKLGREMGIEVTDEMVDEAVLDHRRAGGIERSEESFSKILQDNFGLTMREYRRMIYLTLMKMKVSEAIDTEAKQLVMEVENKIAEGKDLATIAQELSGKVYYEETGGLVDNMNIDGGRAVVALAMEVGQVSGKFLSNNGDGYYFVKVIAKTEEGVSYSSIRVPFIKFDTEMTELRQTGQVEEYIEFNE
ncbi:SurA N-terminal domain-containing protein [Candidatus Saccharibacteria bacterium]|nr:SurA N-terminal domain-containing protein [Candidatus Saccharibacteria bacterium]